MSDAYLLASREHRNSDRGYGFRASSLRSGPGTTVLRKGNAWTSVVVTPPEITTPAMSDPVAIDIS